MAAIPEIETVLSAAAAVKLRNACGLRAAAPRVMLHRPEWGQCSSRRNLRKAFAGEGKTAYDADESADVKKAMCRPRTRPPSVPYRDAGFSGSGR